MKTKIQSLLLISAYFAGIHQMFAQGTAFTYQGRLNNDGNPASGLYDFQFSLSNAPSGGNQIGSTVSLTAVNVTNGLFVVTLDFGSVFTGNLPWLGISVRTNGTVSYNALSPLQQITPTPCAMFANTASNVSGMVPTSVLPGFQSPSYTTVGGGQNNKANGPYDVIGGGNQNTNTASYTTIGGGYNNKSTTAQYITIGGGRFNAAGANDATIAGGVGNSNGAAAATIGGGYNNVAAASANNATIGGGQFNQVTGPNATVGGGAYNTAGPGDSSTVPGGNGNLASGLYSLAAGHEAQATNEGTFVWADSQGMPFTSLANDQFLIRAQGGVGINTNNPNGVALNVNGVVMAESFQSPAGNFGGFNGGTANIASGNHATAIGYGSTASGGASTAIGENDQATGTDATAIGAVALASGVGSTAIGQETTASGRFSTALGWYTTASGDHSFAAGQNAQATNDGAFVWADSQVSYFTSTANDQFLIRAQGGVGINTNNPNGAALSVNGVVAATRFQSQSKGSFIGGDNSTASGNHSTAIGDNSTASGTDSTAMGAATTASGTGSTAMGGGSTVASGFFSTAMGVGCTAGGAYSFAAGEGAKAMNNGSFVWCDRSGGATSTADDQFMARASGGVIFYSSSGTAAGVSLAAGSGSWSSLSDRNAKANFAPVTPRQVLDKVAELPITRWNYKTEQNVSHIGPMAQDFYAAFGVGEDDKHITTVDEDGVALAAIQGLNQKLEETRAENAELKQRLATLEKIVLHQKSN